MPVVIAYWPILVLLLLRNAISPTHSLRVRTAYTARSLRRSLRGPYGKLVFCALSIASDEETRINSLGGNWCPEGINLFHHVKSKIEMRTASGDNLSRSSHSPLPVRKINSPPAPTTGGGKATPGSKGNASREKHSSLDVRGYVVCACVVSCL